MVSLLFLCDFSWPVASFPLQITNRKVLFNTSNMAGLWSPQKFASNQNKIQVLYGVCNGSTYLHVVVFSWSRAQNWVILSHIMITNPCGGYLVNPHMIKKLWYFIVNPEGRLFEWQWNNSATLNWCCEKTAYKIQMETLGSSDSLLLI